MDKKSFRTKVIARIAFNSRMDNMGFLEVIKGVKSPYTLSEKLHEHSIKEPLGRNDLIIFLGMAKQMGIFKIHFKIPEMEKTWRRWVDAQEPGLSNKFRFES